MRDLFLHCHPLASTAEHRWSGTSTCESSESVWLSVSWLSGACFCEFEVVEAKKGEYTVAVFLINAPDYPLVFEKPGTYPIENNRQATAFSQGTVYFRHGAKSEPGTSDDLRKFMQHRMREMQDQLVRGMRKVAEAPRGARLEVVSGVPVGEPSAHGVPFRITNDPHAPGVIPVDRHKLCPHRQKDVIAKLKERLPNGGSPTSHGLRAVNKVHDVMGKEAFAWKPQFSSPQYSDAYIDWIVERIQEEPSFLHDACQRLQEMLMTCPH
jgi:hypothetical protein